MGRNFRTQSNLIILFSVLALLRPEVSWADASYHTVGWVNAFLPGGGQLLLGHPGQAAFQAVSELTTFGWGYSLSARSPLTLDGVPEDIPNPKVVATHIQTRGQYCAVHPKDAICGRGSPSDKLLVTTFDRTAQNIQKSLGADILQEIGIKYHFVNVFNAYREAAGSTARIDKTPTGDLFLAPFKWSVLSEPQVYVPLSVTFAVLAGSYYFTVKDGVAPGPKLTRGSNRLYALTYSTVFPFGSAVPEEMFYRGFLQNEFYSWVPSYWFAVPMSTLAYAFSHSSQDLPSAAVAGFWQGTVTYMNRGLLSKGIAYHFWADVLAGLLEIQLLQKSQYYPTSTQVFDFTWYF